MHMVQTGHRMIACTW